MRHVTEEGLGDVDLEEAMEKTTNEPKTMTSTTLTVTTATATATMVSFSCVVTAEVYSKPNTKSAEERGECSTARSKRRESLE